MFCKYKDIFGKPGTGVHSYRIYNIAIVDLFFTILAAYIIFVLKYKNYNLLNLKFIKILLILLLLSVFLHWLFCVDTTVIKLLNLSRI